MNRELAAGLSPELQKALQPLLDEIESLSERIREYNERVQQIAQESYRGSSAGTSEGSRNADCTDLRVDAGRPASLSQKSGRGLLSGTTTGRRNSGQSEPQLHISKEGDPYLRTMMVQSAHHILGPFGVDSDLRRWV